MRYCNICQGQTEYIFTSKILRKYSVAYYCCKTCGFLQTESPYWLDEAYTDAIVSADTGVLARNLYSREKTAVLIHRFFDVSGRFVDFAGGYGILTRAMRDTGFDFYWHDKYAPNLLARGFEYTEGLKSVELVTAFECFEHFVHPMAEIEKMLAIAPNILFSTHLLPSPVPAPDAWWYYAPLQGQHISFYSLQTIEYIARKFNLTLRSNGSHFHLLTKKSIRKGAFKGALNHAKRYFRRKIAKRMLSKTETDAAMIRQSEGENREDPV